MILTICASPDLSGYNVPGHEKVASMFEKEGSYRNIYIYNSTEQSCGELSFYGLSSKQSHLQYW